MAASQVQGKAALEKAQEKARAMSLSTNDPKFNTPLIPANSATLIVHASARINAPASLAFRVLRNTETWRDWNNFVPRVTIRSQPPDDSATDAEIADLVINTSRLGSIDSDITDGAANPPKKPASPTPAADPDSSRRASVASGKSDGLSAAQRYAQSQTSGRRASAVSTKSGMSTSAVNPEIAAALSDSPRSASPVAPPKAAKLVETSSPSSGGVLIQHGTTANGKPATPASVARRRLSLYAMYGEPSIRLKVNTTMTLHQRMSLPLRPAAYTDKPFVVTEVSRPDDLTEVVSRPDDLHSENDVLPSPQSGASRPQLTRTKTHTLSRSGVYRIVWGTDHKADKRPKFMLTSQWVTEVRPVVRGDGKEECEIVTWESWKGVQAGGIKKQYQGYLFERFQDWVLGLRDYCEAMGGAVERRDFLYNR